MRNSGSAGRYRGGQRRSIEREVRRRSSHERRDGMLELGARVDLGDTHALLDAMDDRSR